MSELINLLIIGNGGREHALGWKLRQSTKAGEIYFSPGNGGTSSVGRNIVLDNSDHPEVLSWIEEHEIGLVVIGPDQYIAEGLADSLRKEGIRVFGPTRAAAEIEWSKSFAKRFMLEEGIPTASFMTFTDMKAAGDYVRDQKFPLVIKADGLASGKGVIIANNLREAEEALDSIMAKKTYGDAGATIVIEEYLKGEEISIHAFCDGRTAVLFPPSQDHKRIHENDQGPNTGGMGTVAPLPWVKDDMIKEIERKIIKPTIAGLRKRGREFVGVLYPGIMITKDGPKVIEFNARFGDPETQSYLPLLETDLANILLACIDGRLDSIDIVWNKRSACCIVLASGGYPGKYEKDLKISGLEEIDQENTLIFHAGTKKVDDRTLTNGGRVLDVVSSGTDLKSALYSAYQAVDKIKFDKMQFRRDIGRKSL